MFPPGVGYPGCSSNSRVGPDGFFLFSGESFETPIRVGLSFVFILRILRVGVLSTQRLGGGTVVCGTVIPGCSLYAGKGEEFFSR